MQRNLIIEEKKENEVALQLSKRFAFNLSELN